MAQARSPAGSGENTGKGSEYIDNTTQYPTELVWTEAPNRTNRLDNVDEFQFELSGSSTGEVASFVAKANGRVTGITVYNGSVANDGTNGWELDILNESRSDAELAHFGLGTGTNAASANDNKAVAANSVATLSNSLVATTAHFSTGDVITVDATEDGTAGVVHVIVHLSYESQGYAS